MRRETPEPHGVLQGEDWNGAVALGLIVRHGRGRGRGKGRVLVLGWYWYRSDNLIITIKCRAIVNRKAHSL